MEALLTLYTKQGQSSALELALESSSAVLTATPRRVVENGIDLVCVCEGPCTSLYCLEDRKLTLLGTYIFRRSGNLLVFSVIVGDEVKDFPEDTSAQVPTVAKKTVLGLSADGDLNLVGFIGDAVIIGTCAGYLGMLFVSADRCCVRGKSARVQNTRGVCWCIRADASQCVCISPGTITTVSVVAEEAEAVTRITEFEEGAVASAATSRAVPECVFLAHEESRNLTVLYGSPDSTLQKKTLQLLSEEVEQLSAVARVMPTIYAFECGGLCLLAVVYPDAVSFTGWEGHTLVSAAAVKNELTTSFGQAFWKAATYGARLYILRSDSRCLMYDVVMSKSFPGIEEVVVVAQQVTLPSHVACLMGGVETGVFLCWRSGTSLARYTALLQSSAEKDKFEPIEVHSTLHRSYTSTSVLLLEVVPIHSNYGIVCLFSTGECQLSLYNSPGTMLLALEEHPFDATSCLAFEGSAGGYSCVLGFNDGDIKVFVGGRMRANVRVAHCGAVDRLLKFPKMNETDDTLFVSMSTEMGTVCCHAGDTAAVSRTMCSPSRPLTACLLHRELEYMFLCSEATGNLWHLPTCRLERAFRSAQGSFDRQLDDLLERHWASAMSIVKFRFLGGEHYAIRVDVNSLLSGFSTAQQSLQRSALEYSSALSLMLRCLGEPCPSLLREDALWEALEDLGLVVAGVQTHECLWCAILLLSGLLSVTSDGVCAASIYSTIQSLGDKLASSATPDPHQQANAMQLFFSRFYTLRGATPAPFRHALRLIANEMPVRSLVDVMSLLLSRALPAQCSEAAEDKTPRALLPLANESAFAAVLVISGLVSQRADYSLEANVAFYDFLCQSTVEAERAVTAALDGDHMMSGHSAALLGLVERHARVCEFGEKGIFQCLVTGLVRRAFGGKDEEAKQVSLEALERLVAQDPQGFLSTYIVTDFHLHAEHRPYIVVFLSRFVKNFPYEAYTVFSTIADIFVSGLSDLSSACKDAASIYHVAVSQLLRVTIASLPNVSLQQSLRHLAVGRRDGKVVVYNMKSATIVTAFQAHSAPVLGVAYSGNITTLDIATIAETLDEIKVWRSPSQSSSLAGFLTGSGGTSFKLITTVDVPSIGLRVESVSLLIQYFQLNWLSPQCVEFSSPWHGKVQVSLP
ncbi:hypothetical protein LSCM1_06509 [Leishmania martiniquensis]|uniref:DUF7048 domain-containing protein n=1 Tax=Leishmania martiniquensis TaxID=1580590 RepID=A0A836KNY0_9TRYP|nr:hypothetical protein LSCM1_06509 [Leishmania martiniquensis]